MGWHRDDAQLGPLASRLCYSQGKSCGSFWGFPPLERYCCLLRSILWIYSWGTSFPQEGFLPSFRMCIYTDLFFLPQRTMYAYHKTHTIYRHWFSPSTWCFLGLNSNPQDWWQAPFPTDPSHWPFRLINVQGTLRRTLNRSWAAMGLPIISVNWGFFLHAWFQDWVKGNNKIFQSLFCFIRKNQNSIICTITSVSC